MSDTKYLELFFWKDILKRFAKFMAQGIGKLIWSGSQYPFSYGYRTLW